MSFSTNGMKVLMLSIDSKVFEEGSLANSRMLDYEALVDEIHIVVYTRPGYTNKTLGSNIYLYPTNTKWRPLYFSKAFSICKKIISPEFIITSQDAMTNLVAIRLKKKFRNKLEVQIHTDFMSEGFKRESFTNFIRFRAYKWGISNADIVRVVSKRIKDSLGEGVRSIVLPISLEVSKSKEKIEFPEFSKVVLVVSRLTKEKNVALSIDVFSRIKDRGIGLVIVGNGPERAMLEEKAKGLNVKFEGWRDNVAAYYNSSDVYLHTSNYEGYGISLIEAASANLPIVTTNVGVVGYELPEQDGVYICDVGDQKCLSNSLSKAISLEKSRKNISLLSKDELRAKQGELWNRLML